MAGDMEEPVNISFQADLLHSGSISFGRFENESLCWERRSSFSHNRYLEEFEKFSKPGSVIEKKAILEAHFKKRGHLSPDSPNCKNGAIKQVSATDVKINGKTKQTEHKKEGDHCTQFAESPESSLYHGQSDVTEYERADPDSSEYKGEHELIIQYKRADPGHSRYDEKSEVTEFKRENSNEASFSEPAVSNLNFLVDNVVEDAIPDKTHQITETACKKFSSINDEDRELNQSHDDKSSHSVDASPKNEQSGKVYDTSPRGWKKSSPKMKPALELKTPKPRVISSTKVSPVQRNVSGCIPKDPAKGLGITNREATHKLYTDKKKLNIPTSHSIRKTSNFEDSRSLQLNLSYDNKSSEKETKRKKAAESQPFFKTKSKGQRMAKSFNGGDISWTKTDRRSEAAALNFRSDERAERRKEFFEKLEGKMQAKEAEISKIQRTTQEKTEAEIRQMRRCLNFKATPMPSFYNVPSTRSDGSKAVSLKSQLSIVQGKTNSGRRAATELHVHLKAGISQSPSATDSRKSVEPSGASGEKYRTTAEPSEASTISTNSVSHKPSTAKVLTKTDIAKNKGRDKYGNQSEHKISESRMKGKNQTMERKQKIVAQRSDQDMTTKSKVDIGSRSSATIGHLSVHVTS